MFLKEKIAFLLIVLVGLLLIVSVYVFLYGFGSSEKISPVISPEVTPSSQQLNEEVAKAEKTFWHEARFDEAVSKLEAVAASSTGSENDVYARLNLATKLLRTDNKRAADILIAIYNDPAAQPSQKNFALETIAWHINSLYSVQGIDNAFVNRVMGQDGFRILAEGKSVKNLGDALDVTRKAFVVVLEADQTRYIPHILIAETIGRSKGNLTEEDVKTINYHLGEGIKYMQADLNDSLKKAIYIPSIGSMLTHVVTVHFRLFQGEVGSAEEVYKASDNLFSYTETFIKDNYSAAVSASEVAARYAISLVIENKFKLNQAQKDKVQGIFKKYLYTLWEGSLERRHWLRGHGGDTTKFTPTGLERRKALVYLANEVDPDLKDFLIGKIGGWTEKDFQ